MNAEAKKLIEEFLSMHGQKDAEYFRKFIGRIADNHRKNPYDHEALIKLTYVFNKLEHGLSLAMRFGSLFPVVEDTQEDIEAFFEKHLPGDLNKDLGKLKPPKNKRNLGKLVDEGDVPTNRSRADEYWSERTKVIFTPTNKKIRVGFPIPKSYLYTDEDFLMRHYQLRSIEFGNWLSQQDRRNYLAALGLALFDLHKLLGFSPANISLKGKITVAFGARGRGAALAHFEHNTFAINITRYERPEKGSTKGKEFDRTSLLTASGGMGSFAHEYGHALDYYAGTFIEKHPARAVSGGASIRTRPDKAFISKSGVTGIMERILDKIIWEKKGRHTPYYLKIAKAVKNGAGEGDYYLRRNEIFARAFEVYIHYKMQKKKYKNIFLAETKYQSVFYLSLNEIKKVEKDIDSLVSAIKRKA